MRASELILLIQERIAEFGDMDIATFDGGVLEPVADVTFSSLDGNNQCMAIE